MLHVPAAKASTPTGTVAYWLGTVGAVVAQRYADRVAPLDLKLKHVGLLTLLATGRPESQLDLARHMGIAPSLVVRLADHLESLGALERTRDSRDRRRQTLRLTAHGRTLLARCTELSRATDAELLAGVPAADRAALHAILERIAGNLGSAPYDARVSPIPTTVA
jgi:DNA-binding MarR family transcriptional regulator